LGYATLAIEGQDIMPKGSKVAKRQKAESIHDRDRIIIRLPDGMRDKIAAMALANGRSMTAEVIAALEQHLKGADRVTEMWEFFDRHREEIERIPIAYAAIENLEVDASRAGDVFVPILTRWLQKNKEREARAAELPPITTEQAETIRRAVKDTAWNEAAFLEVLRRVGRSRSE
jgi:plasmid stability protein